MFLQWKLLTGRRLRTCSPDALYGLLFHDLPLSAARRSRKLFWSVLEPASCRRTTSGFLLAMNLQMSSTLESFAFFTLNDTTRSRVVVVGDPPSVGVPP